MKRKIKALKVLLSDFYSKHETMIAYLTIAFFVVVGAIVFGIYGYNETKTEKITKQEERYLDSKMLPLGEANIQTIFKQLKKLEKEGYEYTYKVKDDYVQITLSITNKESKTEIANRIYKYSYDGEISKETSYGDVKFYHVYITVLFACCGGIIGLAILGVIVFIPDVINKIRSKWREALEKVDEMNAEAVKEEIQCEENLLEKSEAEEETEDF